MTTRVVRITRAGARPAVAALLGNGSVVPAGRGVRVADVLSDTRQRESLERNIERAAADPDGARADGLLIDPEGVELRAPVDRGVTVVNIGTNYRDHDDEIGVGSADISWFAKSRHCLIGPGATIELPAQFPDHVDYEGELCVVFGRACYRVNAADADRYIGGYTLMNDVSARDAWPQIHAARTAREGREAWSRMLLGKQLPTFGPTGPVVVPADQIEEVTRLRLTTRLNGDIVQDAPASNMKVPIADLIARLSQYFSFRPGDVLSTGTPPGVGLSRQPQRFLRPGDRVSVTVDGIGTLTNAVADAPA